MNRLDELANEIKQESIKLDALKHEYGLCKVMLWRYVNDNFTEISNEQLKDILNSTVLIGSNGKVKFSNL